MQADQVANGFDAQKDFVRLASACTKLPSSAPEYQDLIGPTQTALMAVIEAKEKNRAAKESNQLTVVSEGIPALGWVTLVSLRDRELLRALRATERYVGSRDRTASPARTSASSRTAACSG